MLFLPFISAVLQLFHLYTGKIQISTKNEIAESRGVLEHKRAKGIFPPNEDNTQKLGLGRKFLHVSSFQKKAVAETYPPFGK